LVARPRDPPGPAGIACSTPPDPLAGPRGVSTGKGEAGRKMWEERSGRKEGMGGEGKGDKGYGKDRPSKHKKKNKMRRDVRSSRDQFFWLN